MFPNIFTSSLLLISKINKPHNPNIKPNILLNDRFSYLKKIMETDYGQTRLIGKTSKTPSLKLRI